MKTEYWASGDAAKGAPGWTRGAIKSAGLGTPISAISDGTSNTALVTERCVGETSTYLQANNVSGGYYKTNITLEVSGTPGVFSDQGDSVPVAEGHYSTGAVSGTFDPSVCLTVRNGSEIKSTIQVWPAGGTEWYNANTRFTWANFILAPNAPSCGSRDVRAHGTAILPTSYHPNGVNLALCDASVRFVTDTVNTGTLAGQKCCRNGTSPYGVWGALGSRDGGESHAVP